MALNSLRLAFLCKRQHKMIAVELSKSPVDKKEMWYTNSPTDNTCMQINLVCMYLPHGSTFKAKTQQAYIYPSLYISNREPIK